MITSLFIYMKLKAMDLALQHVSVSFDAKNGSFVMYCIIIIEFNNQALNKKLKIF